MLAYESPRLLSDNKQAGAFNTKMRRKFYNSGNTAINLSKNIFDIPKHQMATPFGVFKTLTGFGF
ncbi:MAG: hypothetical protein DCF20_02485 [Pseudanabaena sp.]|nr:MAG: hypothetical protein DCF20_02485 [Pseudanabaena sp.]